MGGRGSSSSSRGGSLAVRENPAFRKEIGNARYAVQISSLGGIRTIDFNSTNRTDNAEKTLHSIDAYGNMKIAQRTGSSDIYLLTESQMKKANKAMPTRKELQNDRDSAMEKIQNILKQNAGKVIKPEKTRTTRRRRTADDDLLF